MKKLILILIVAVGITACKKDEFSLRPMGTGSTTTTTSIPDPPDKELASWRIAILVNEGSNVTSKFIGYSFQFHPNGILTATKKGITTKGHWSNRTETDQPKLNITFDSGPLMELNNNWDVTQRHVNVIKLEIVTGKDMTDYLDFQKI